MNALRFDHGETIDMLRESVRGFAAKEIAPRLDDARDVLRSSQ